MEVCRIWTNHSFIPFHYSEIPGTILMENKSKVSVNSTFIEVSFQWSCSYSMQWLKHLSTRYGSLSKLLIADSPIQSSFLSSKQTTITTLQRDVRMWRHQPNMTSSDQVIHSPGTIVQRSTFSSPELSPCPSEVRWVSPSGSLISVAKLTFPIPFIEPPCIMGFISCTIGFMSIGSALERPGDAWKLAKWKSR